MKRLLACSLVAMADFSTLSAATLPEATLVEIIDTFAGNVYRRGETTALVVGVTLNGQTYFQSYGFKDFQNQNPGNEVNEHSIFEIGSVTKVWTTALVGQAIATGGFTSEPIGLYTPIGDFTGPLPGLQPAMAAATIGDLASFTAGLPDVGDTHGKGHRPPISEWGVQDFVNAISALVPTDYTERKPAPTTLPAPYFYSDWSTGLLGLLVTNDLSAPLPPNAVEIWNQAILDSIVTPLGMEDTFLTTPGAGQGDRVVSGYAQPTAEARVIRDKIASVSLNTLGAGYPDDVTPAVSIIQPGGSGATAVAIMEGTAPNRTVKSIRITNGGSGYRPPARVVFSGPGKGASGQAIVKDGAIVGVQLTSGGKGYTRPPEVYFRGKVGSGASGTGIVSGGRVVGVVITSQGSGYAPQPGVVIEPGNNLVNVVPVWAAAGALKSSCSDLVRLCQLYLGASEIGGNPVPRDLSDGARQALLPLIQNAPTTPGAFTGMTWLVTTNSIEGGLNMLAAKDGGLPGFATYVTLVPALKLGIVILRSNNQSNIGEYADPIGAVADAIATGIQLELMPQ